jgi:peptidoglycan/xylan/chitin deacetylase (PgdA/CDA1 family)
MALPEDRTPPRRARSVAITFDDLPAVKAAFPPVEACHFAAIESATQRLLQTAGTNGVPLTGFVNEGKQCPEWKPGSLAMLLSAWLDAGAELGNHTYSHVDLYNTSLAAYKADIVRGEAALNAALDKRGKRLRYFRHPYLHSGLDPGVRKDLRRFLEGRGYIDAPVTIDNQDWMFSEVYARAKGSHDEKTMAQVVGAYLSYVDELCAHSEQLSRQVLGYEVRQILLMHASALNFEHFDEIVNVVRRRGYRFISLEEALGDKAYRESVPPKGSWLRGLATRKGKPPRIGPRVTAFLGTLYRDYPAAPPAAPGQGNEPALPAMAEETGATR